MGVVSSIDFFWSNMANPAIGTLVPGASVLIEAAEVFRPLTAVLGGVGPPEFFFFYLFVVALLPAIWDWSRGKGGGGADHPCHLGGAALGLVWAFVTDEKGLQQTASWSRHWVLVGACAGLLVMRVVGNERL